MNERARSDIVQLKVRTKEPLRAELEKAAAERGVSMNTEIVDRLEKSFAQDERLQDLFGSRELYGLMKMVATAMTITGETSEGLSKLFGREIEWLKDPYAFDRAVDSATRVLSAFRPAGDVIDSFGAKEDANKEEIDSSPGLGLNIADLLMDDVTSDVGKIPDDRIQRRKRLRTELGPLIDVLKQNRARK